MGFLIKWTIIIANHYYRNKLACCYLYVDIHTSNGRTPLLYYSRGVAIDYSNSKCCSSQHNNARDLNLWH